MTELKNEFFWSKTRDEVFKTCLRQFRHEARHGYSLDFFEPYDYFKIRMVYP
jgi:hypothetical protein